MSELSNREIIDIDLYIEQLKNCQILSENQIKNLCEKVINNQYQILLLILIINKIGQRNFQKREKRSTNKYSPNYLWRYSRPIFRPFRIIQSWW